MTHLVRWFAVHGGFMGIYNQQTIGTHWEYYMNSLVSWDAGVRNIFWGKGMNMDESPSRKQKEHTRIT